jgi:hypothetical protein
MSAPDNSRASAARLTPRNDTRHVPSGPRDLKDFDQPAYLRRGINLPVVDASETPEEVVVAQREPLGRESAKADPAKNRDDRPTFLRRIMD